jgi:hypothetical protein
LRGTAVKLPDIWGLGTARVVRRNRVCCVLCAVARWSCTNLADCSSSDRLSCCALDVRAALCFPMRLREQSLSALTDRPAHGFRCEWWAGSAAPCLPQQRRSCRRGDAVARSECDRSRQDKRTSAFTAGARVYKCCPRFQPSAIALLIVRSGAATAQRETQAKDPCRCG